MDEKFYLVVFGGAQLTVEGYETAEAVALQAVNSKFRENDYAKIIDLATGKIVETFEYV